MFKTFYYEEGVSSVSYTRTPTGDPDVSRLINGQVFWRELLPSKQKKAKNLILSDWTAFNWSEKKINAVCYAFECLIDHGFAIYQWHSSGLIKLEKSTLSQLLTQGTLKDTRPTPPQTILKDATTQLAFSYDQIQILDDYWINVILSGHDNEPRSLKVSDWMVLNNDERSLAIELLKQAKPPLEIMIHDTYSYSANKLLAELKKQVPDCRCQTQYQTLSFERVYVDSDVNIKDIPLKPARLMH